MTGTGTVATTRRARLAPVALPDFGVPDERPEIPPELYARRLERLRELPPFILDTSRAMTVA